MEMKIIKIFLASSITDLKEDRVYLGDFINTLNNSSVDKNLFFRLVKCENYDNSIALSGKQAQYDEEIRNSEVCVFLFFKKVGDFTKHEFEVAMESFRAQDKPKVFTYIKYRENLDDMELEVRNFTDELTSKLQHYYNVYNHIDTLKLEMHNQFELLGLVNNELVVENGKVLLNGEVIASCESVPIFTGNAEYVVLKEERKQVESEYTRLKEQFVCDSENLGMEKAYFEISDKRKKLLERLDEKENQLLKYAEEVARKSGGSNLSERAISGYRLVEQGKYEEALQMLDKDEIFWDIDSNLKEADRAKDEIQKNVNDAIQRERILLSQGVKPEVITEVYEIFEKVYPLTVNYHLDKEVLYNYAHFLCYQRNYIKGIEVGEAYLCRCKETFQQTTELEYIDIYNLLGSLYAHATAWEEGISYYKKAISIAEELYNTDSEQSRLSLKCSYNNLACAYRQTRDMEKSEEYHLKAIDILEELCEGDPETHLPNLACSYNNLANLYRAINKMEEARKYHLKAIDIRQELFGNDNNYAPYLARSYYNLGLLYHQINYVKEAEDLYLYAINIQEQLYKMNPEAYGFDLATSYGDLAELYRQMNYPVEVIEYSKKAENIQKLINTKD